ncbi:MAG: hypothetical protein Q4D04_10165 [Clostridia bacterium]|nr:hypothetical protein [Clostridia bacterium]
MPEDMNKDMNAPGARDDIMAGGGDESPADLSTQTDAVSTPTPDESESVVPRPPDDDEILNGTVDDGYNNDLARKVNALSVDVWKKIQIIAGIILGIASGACLFLMESNADSFIPMNFLIALFLAMIVPNIAQKQLQRKVDIGRNALLIALASVIMIYIVYGLATGTFTQ